MNGRKATKCEIPQGPVGNDYEDEDEDDDVSGSENGQVGLLVKHKMAGSSNKSQYLLKVYLLGALG